MYYYQIAEVRLKSCFALPSFESFSCDPCEPDMTLEETKKQPSAGKDHIAGTIIYRKQQDGWFFHEQETEDEGIYISEDYAWLGLVADRRHFITSLEEWFVRIALECMLARKGYVSLHSAAVEINGDAYTFTGPSGTGKSTRANAWIDSLGAKLINGDRPLIDARHAVLYGVPWDGKEQCFRNVKFPLKAICEVRRSNAVYVRNLSFRQRRKLLTRQCFMPMWDPDTASMQMANLFHLAAETEMVRIFCGPGKEDARALFNVLEEHHYLKEGKDMKAKPGFILRNVVDEYILIPTGENIGKFNGTMILNEVSAFVWEKLQNPMSKEDLVQAVLDEYEVERAVASKDLDSLLETLRGYGVIEDD